MEAVNSHAFFFSTSLGALPDDRVTQTTYANNTAFTDKIANIPAHVALPLSVANSAAPYRSYAAGQAHPLATRYVTAGTATSAIANPHSARTARRSSAFNVRRAQPRPHDDSALGALDASDMPHAPNKTVRS